MGVMLNDARDMAQWMKSEGMIDIPVLFRVMKNNEKYYLLLPRRYFMKSLLRHLLAFGIMLFVGSYMSWWVFCLPISLVLLLRYHKFTTHCTVFNVARWKLWLILAVCCGVVAYASFYFWRWIG